MPQSYAGRGHYNLAWSTNWHGAWIGKYEICRRMANLTGRAFILGSSSLGFRWLISSSLATLEGSNCMVTMVTMYWMTQTDSVLESRQVPSVHGAFYYLPSHTKLSSAQKSERPSVKYSIIGEIYFAHSQSNWGKQISWLGESFYVVLPSLATRQTALAKIEDCMLKLRMKLKSRLPCLALLRVR